MKKYLYDEMYQEEAIHWWYSAKRKIILNLIDKLFEDKENISVLNAGCGCGYILSCLTGFKKVEALDYDQTAIDYTKQRFIGNVYLANLSDLNTLPLRKYDLILLSDVLEHIEQDELALKNLKTLLNKTGKLILTVPAHMYLWSYHDVECMHKRRYEKEELMNKAQKAGFHIDFCSYYNSKLYTVIYFIRKIKSLKLQRIDNDGKMPSKAINSLLYHIFVSESNHINKFKNYKNGISLISVLS